MNQILECFDQEGVKWCEIDHAEELTATELEEVLKAQAYQNRWCRIKEEGDEKRDY